MLICILLIGVMAGCGSKGDTAEYNIDSISSESSYCDHIGHETENTIKSIEGVSSVNVKVTEEDKQEYSADVFINTDDDFDDGTLEQIKEYLDNTFTDVSILVNGNAI